MPVTPADADVPPRRLADELDEPDDEEELEDDEPEEDDELDEEAELDEEDDEEDELDEEDDDDELELDELDDASSGPAGLSAHPPSMPTPARAAPPERMRRNLRRSALEYEILSRSRLPKGTSVAARNGGRR